MTVWIYVDTSKQVGDVDQRGGPDSFAPSSSPVDKKARPGGESVGGLEKCWGASTPYVIAEAKSL
jgi:hypothetical protein